MKNKKLFLLDMDGTIYLDNELFDGTLDFLDHVKKIGGKYMFLTNNSSKSVTAYVDKLASLGINSCKEDFLTSTQATSLYLNNNYKDKVIYAFGTKSFKEELIESGLKITDKLSGGIEVLVMGFDTELTFQKLEDACILLGRNIPFIATNPDLVCPTWYGYVPDCGSVSTMLYNATGKKPLFIGKPQPEMVYLAMQKAGFGKEETLLVGDRIYTDIACGVNAGIDTVLVLSGETKKEQALLSDTKPTYILENIKELL
ncbi:MAG: HAD-IIA family hydrolase [Bacillota bacterium]|nr:HAD-IIA family hydrolase [Bacillota bacterium]